MGMEVGSFQLEKLVVLSDVDPPPAATPTATHVVETEQDTEDRNPTGGWERVAHEFPS
jgi:hypothetical protein